VTATGVVDDSLIMLTNTREYIRR
jgi:hypothetical protein